MKKIFAIALALVMVLSMASAFAAANVPGTCSWGSWDCPTTTIKCGIAKAEVVLFVKGNNCYETYTESNCAGVVKGEHLFYGVKVTFEENVNEQWFNHANTKLNITYKDIAPAYLGTNNKNQISRNLNGMGKAYSDVKKGGVFWVKFNNGNIQNLVSADDFDDNCVTDGWAITTKAKVCANVEFKFDGKGMDLAFGDYTVYVNQDNTIWVKNASYAVKFTISDGKLGKAEVGGVGQWDANMQNPTKTYYGYNKDGLLATMVGNEIKWESVNCNEAAFLMDVFKTFKFDFSTCITADGIKSFFGWDDDGAFKSCKTWNKDAVAIANAECQVAIPKTGDVSVVAYAVMALVAAAGAMGLKK